MKNNAKFNSFSYKSITSKIITIFTILAVIPIMWISFYNHPSADDFNYSEIYTQDAVNEGENVVGILQAAFKTALYFQENWQGTYSAAFLDSLHPGIYGTHEEYYSLTAYIIMLSIFIAIYFFIREFLLSCNYSCKHTVVITFVIALTIIEGFPSPVQGLFWYTGAMTYMFFWSFMLIQAAILLSINRNTKHLKAKTIFCIVNAFFVAGGNHITAFITILVSAGFLVYSIIARKKLLIVSYTLSVLSSIGGFVLVMTAPGTAVRANTLERQSIIKTMIISIINTLGDIEQYINLPLILAFCLIIMLLGFHIVNDSNKQYFKIEYYFLMFILSFGIYCASFCVPYYAMGATGAGRVFDMRYALFVILAFINFLYLYGCILSFILSNVNLLTTICKIISIIKELFSTKAVKFAITFFTISAMTIIVFFSYRTSVTTNCTIELLNGEAKKWHEEKSQYIGTDLNNPTYMPRMIYYSSSMPDA